MKIAILCEYYHPHLGGLEMRAKGIAEEFVRRGHAVTVFTVGYEPGLPDREIINGVLVRRYASHLYSKPGVRFVRRGMRAMVGYALWCRRQARGDFNFLFYIEFPIIHALLAPAHARAKAAMDWCEFRRDRIFGVLQKWVPRLFRLNTCVAESVGREMHAVSGKEFYCLPSGISISEFRPEISQRRGMIYIGRLQPHKNLPFLISCFEELCKRGYQEPLILMGGGSEEAMLRTLCEKSPYRDLITMTGVVNENDKVEALANAKAMILVSGREGFPVSIAEAMASAVPTVTVDLPENGGAFVVRQYQCGVVTQPAVSAVADGIETVLRDRDIYARACLDAAKTLDWRAVAQSFLDYIHETGVTTVRSASDSNESVSVPKLV